MPTQVARRWRAPGPLACRSILAVVATFALAAPAVLAADATARFKPLAGPVAAKGLKPLSIDGSTPVKVVVQLQSESVAEARARVATRALTADEERSVVATARREHAAIHGAIQGLGGRVVAEYQHALNGVAVSIPRHQVASLATLPGVVAVHPVTTFRVSNAVSVPYLNAPAVWAGHPALKGEGVKIAIIDTGIDYTHADFGGPGTPAAYAAAAATSTLPADPTLFGPNAPKVKGGIDLVGDAYNADDPTTAPMPDPNPLDCYGHGTHVAGSAAGFGVAGGATYGGPWSPAAYTTTTFDVGPGVAPKADLYAVRVFGCAGTTNVVTDAIEWAVANHMDVISMSLGSPFGTADSADAVAARNAARAGITVVAAAGNEGPSPYITGTPASGDHVISAAAMDAREFFPNGVRVTLSSGSADGLEANSAPLPAGTVPVVVLKSGSGLALGCPDGTGAYPDYPANLPAGALVILSRGSCTFVAKAQGAALAGASAIAVVNNAAGFVNPSIPGVTLPFIVLQLADTPTILAAGPSGSVMAANVANPAFETVASFSSGGPRFGDNAFKPNVTAPGVGINSAAVGTGNAGVVESGTSMATPHVAGVAALTRQAHPNWDRKAIEQAIVETANPGLLSGGDPRLTGAGVVQPVGATTTSVVASDDHGNPSLSFGFEESTRDYADSETLTVRNLGRGRARYNLSYSPAATATGVPHTLTLSRTSVALEGGESEDIRVTLKVPAATVGGTHDAAYNLRYADAAGYLVLTPASGSAPALSVPYYLTTRARSNLAADLVGNLSARHPAAGVKLSNRGGALPGTADFYAWGLSSRPQGDPFFDTRAVGVQSNLAGGDSLLVFAVNTWTKFPNAAVGEWDVLIDVNGDGAADYVLFTGDHGVWTSATGSPDGIAIVLLYQIATQSLSLVAYADAATDGSTVLMPVWASNLGITAANPAFSYQVQYFNNLSGNGYAMPGSATFNAFTPSITNAAYYTVPAGVSGTVPVAIDPVQWKTTPALGLMVVSQDNASGTPQAQLLRAGDR